MSQKESPFVQMVNEIVDYAILTMDKNGFVQNWNNGARRIKGYEASEIVGRNFEIFYTPEDKIANKHLDLLALATNEGRASDEGWRVKRSGELFWASVTITAIHDENNEIIGFSKVTRDLTERRNAELALKKQFEELANKNRELEQFAYIASHDLQEPLRTILNCSMILQRAHAEKLDDHGKKTLSFITDASNRMSGLIKGLLDYSRLGKESPLLRINPVAIIQEIQSDLALRIEETGATIQVGEIPPINGYETEFRALLQNLITNALKFRKPEVKPVINISASPKGSGWQFSIADNGIGIAEEHLDKVFKIFQRIHNRNQYEGHGIGLAHCQKIAELHRGTIWVESKLDVGSTFHFTVFTN